MSYTTVFWWNSDKESDLRFFAVCLLITCAGLAITIPSYAAEPILNVREADIKDLLSPEALPPGFYTFEREEYWAEPLDSWWMDFSNWIIHQERWHSPRVQRFGAWADRTLSGSGQALPNNESYLRLGFAAESEYSNLAQFEPEARFRLDLPTTEEKLRLVIESESEELIPLSERERDRQLTEPERTDTEATGALRYLTQIGDAINLTTDIGGRLRFPPEAFWRMTAQKAWWMDKNWRTSVQQRVYYFHTEGWGSRSWFSATRFLNNGWQFYADSELEWIHDERKFEAAQIFSVRKQLNNRSAVIPRLGILGESQPSWRTTSYFADVTWRYRMYDDWLFAELIPALEFPRDRSFKDEASVIFRVEMFFAGVLDQD